LLEQSSRAEQVRSSGPDCLATQPGPGYLSDWQADGERVYPRTMYPAANKVIVSYTASMGGRC